MADSIIEFQYLGDDSDKVLAVRQMSFAPLEMTIFGFPRRELAMNAGSIPTHSRHGDLRMEPIPLESRKVAVIVL
jgi:hypothetical protein